MKINSRLVLLTSLSVVACQSDREPNSTMLRPQYLSYRPLSSICLSQKRASIKSAFPRVRPVEDYENSPDCLLDLPSPYFKGHELAPIAYFYYDSDERLAKAVIVFTVGTDSGIDTTAIKKVIMAQFKPVQKDLGESYSFDLSGNFKQFTYVAKQNGLTGKRSFPNTK